MSEDKARDEEKQALKAAEEERLNESEAAANNEGDTAKFINGDAAQVQVAMPSEKSKEFLGLSKEELMEYSNDPFWVRVRWIMFIGFWLAWFAMLAGAIIIIVLAPRCPYRADLKWWQEDVVYQVYPRSFKDSNDDGVGDLQGIKSKLGYIKNDLGANAIYMNSVYKSHNKDFDYDVVDFKAIDPIFGTMEDFHNLLSSMHGMDMKLIMDFSPNHVSSSHRWFNASKKGGDDNKYKDYFVWKDAANSWESALGGSAWTMNDDRKEYYLHTFREDQPDLNLRCPKVRQEIKEIMDFWLSKGVDGFRVAAAKHLIESNETSTAESAIFQPETYDLVAEWRDLLDYYTDETERPRLLAVEASGTTEQVMSFYEYNGNDGAHMPINMDLVDIKKGCGGKCVRDLVHNWMTNLPDGKWANWVVGNQDTSRVATRKGTEYIRAVDMLVKLLPGTVFTYYGDELGMLDGSISDADAKDFLTGDESRDPERTPMQWDATNYAGFTNSSQGPWLPVNPDFLQNNARAMLAHGAGVTALNVYKELSKLRQQPSFQWGKYHEAVTDDSLFSFVRSAEGFAGYLVAVNFGPSKTTVDFHSVRKDIVPATATVVASTQNFKDFSRHHDFKINTNVELDQIHLQPGEGVVFEWPADVFDE